MALINITVRFLCRLLKLNRLNVYNKGTCIHFMICIIMCFQKYAVEALVHSASKKDKCSGLIKQATPILKELYQSQNDYIKVRALVVSLMFSIYGQI